MPGWFWAGRGGAITPFMTTGMAVPASTVGGAFLT